MFYRLFIVYLIDSDKSKTIYCSYLQTVVRMIEYSRTHYLVHFFNAFFVTVGVEDE